MWQARQSIPALSTGTKNEIEVLEAFQRLGLTIQEKRGMSGITTNNPTPSWMRLTSYKPPCHVTYRGTGHESSS